MSIFHFVPRGFTPAEWADAYPDETPQLPPPNNTLTDGQIHILETCRNNGRIPAEWANAHRDTPPPPTTETTPSNHASTAASSSHARKDISTSPRPYY